MTCWPVRISRRAKQIRAGCHLFRLFDIESLLSTCQIRIPDDECNRMDWHTVDYISRGTLLGLAAGFSPGPLTFLVIAETLRHGLRSGIQVAMAPLLTDIPIILFTFVILERLRQHPELFGVISLAGGIFLLHLGIDSFRSRATDSQKVAVQARSLRRGVLVNFLNPNPYVFWVSVGTPTILGALHMSAAHAGVFVIAFFLVIVGSKVLLAKIVDKSRLFLDSKAYRWMLRVLGGLLVVYAISFFREGLSKLGIQLFSWNVPNHFFRITGFGS